MLAHLATGGGKTVIFSELPKLLAARRTLVVAHREELLKQAQSKLQDAGLAAELEQASNKASSTCPVVVASIQSLNANGRLYKFSPYEFDLIVIDECHHAAAKSYLRIVDYFSKAVVVGFTATPYRSDEADLLEVFTDGVVFSMGMEELTHQGFLAPIHKIERIVPSLDAPHVLQVYKELAPGQKTIVFCHDVDHSMQVARRFNDDGIKTAFIHGGMAKKEREETLQQYSKNGIKVLANCNVLTEGYDEPSVQCVMLARNTDSRGLYEQMIGRGTRLHAGKTHLKVIELSVAPPVTQTPRMPLEGSYELPGGFYEQPSYRPAGNFMHQAQEAVWMLVVFALLIGSFVGLGYAIRHCNQELRGTSKPAPTIMTPVVKEKKNGRNRHRAGRSKAKLRRNIKTSF